MRKMSVPKPWRDFTVRQQGELDFACGPYCLINAAVGLGVLDDDAGGLVTTLDNLRRADPEAFSEVASVALRVGTRETHLRRLGAAAGVNVKRVNTPTLDQMSHDPGHPAFHMALVRVDFSDPAKRAQYHGEPYPWAHFVLVLDVKDDLVVVADPHPWRERLSAVPRSTFLAWWKAGRGAHRSPWAARITASPRP
jgi:hypothetical protein